MTRNIIELFQQAYEDGASDIHLSFDMPPAIRKNGQLKRVDQPPLTSADLTSILKTLLPEKKHADFEQNGEADFNFAIPNVCRFRVNAFKQRGEISVAARIISSHIPSLESLNMPTVLYDLAEKPQGLILVTGPTGSGKSTTLASMIDYVNERYAKHIITLEDPIEYLHEHRKSIVQQREVGNDTNSFANGLRAALRQDPEVILVGEMRDLETISTAITAAETGHLVLATLHTSSAATTIDRIIDVFPAHQQSQVRIQIANVLQGIVSQRLLVKKDNQGRIAATEILVQTPAIQNLIRDEKVHQIQNILQTNRNLGMHTLEMSIQRLLTRGEIDYEAAKPFLPEGAY